MKPQSNAFAPDRPAEADSSASTMKLDGIEMTADVQHAIELVQQKKLVFITGRAGSGKSSLIPTLCEQLPDQPVILAPTGRAALHVGGSTIHRFFGFKPSVTVAKARTTFVRPDRRALLENVRTIIVDEASMLRADLLDCMHAVLRRFGPDRQAPFGGVRIIFVGDLYQLPPVVTDDEGELFETEYSTPYFFSAHALRGMNLPIVELRSNFRQVNVELSNLLDAVRVGEATAADLQLINQQVDREIDYFSDEFEIILATHNKAVQRINTARLDALPGKAHVTRATVEGKFNGQPPTLEKLQYKVGAKIMLLTNTALWVNGSLGQIETMDEDRLRRDAVTVQLHPEQPAAEVNQHTWEILSYKVADGEIQAEAIGKFTQLPFCLAWAVTIHKGQGSTFNRVLIDMGWGAFSTGQTYVALSRCTTLAGITLKQPIRPEWISVDPCVVEFLESGQCR